MGIRSWGGDLRHSVWLPLLAAPEPSREGYSSAGVPEVAPATWA